MCIEYTLYVHTLTHLHTGALDHTQLVGNVTYPMIFFSDGESDDIHKCPYLF